MFLEKSYTDDVSWKIFYGRCFLKNLQWKMLLEKSSMEDVSWKIFNKRCFLKHFQWKIFLEKSTPTEDVSSKINVNGKCSLNNQRQWQMFLEQSTSMANVSWTINVNGKCFLINLCQRKIFHDKSMSIGVSLGHSTSMGNFFLKIPRRWETSPEKSKSTSSEKVSWKIYAHENISQKIYVKGIWLIKKELETLIF